MKRRKFYKDKFNGKLFGVCAGAADYFQVNALWIRLGLLIGVFAGGLPILVPAYVIVALVAESKPPHMYDDSLVRTFGDGETSVRSVDTNGNRTPAKRMEFIDE